MNQTIKTNSGDRKRRNSRFDWSFSQSVKLLFRKWLLLILLAILLLSTSCIRNNKSEGEYYSDNYAYILWETASGIQTPYRINVKTGTGTPACSDPLCNHATSVCPFHNMSASGFCIVGKNAFYLRNYETLKFYRQLCKYDIENGKLKIIYENNAATITGLSVFDDYVYFLEFVSNNGDGNKPVYNFDLLRYSISEDKLVNLGSCGLSQNATAYAYADGRLFWRDPDSKTPYFSTDTDFDNRTDGDKDENSMSDGDYSITLERGDTMKYPVYNIPYSFNIISCKLDTSEKTVILKNTPAVPMTFGNKVFYFEYQDKPLIVGYYEDENGSKTDNPIYDPRGHKLYVCDFNGENGRLLCDFGDNYCFCITNEMLGKSGNDNYFVIKMQRCEISADGVSLDMLGDAIMIIDVNTGEYKEAKME